MKYGLLTVVENLGYRPVYGHNRTFVRAKCDCGKQIEIELARLVGGHKKSCGHLRQDARFRRPQGDVSIDRIVDGFGKVISVEQAVKYGWLKPGIGAVCPYTETDTRNLFVDQGRQLLAYCFGFRAPLYNYTCQNFGVGTGVTAANVTDVALEAPITLSNGQITKAVDMIDFLSAFVVRVSMTLGLADANGYVVSEMGLFSGNNVLIAHKIRSTSINKTSDFAPTLTWRLRF